MPEIPIDTITVGPGRRRATAAKVKELAKSIETIGLQHPIAVRAKGEGKYILAAGRHRLEACRSLGMTHIKAEMFPDKLSADLWEIGENLHRADLKAMERNLQIGRWVELKAEKIEEDQRISRQVGGKMPPGRPESGVEAAARELNIPATSARRAVKISKALTRAAQKAAERLGLDNNQQVLENTARLGMPDSQVAYLQNFVERRTRRAAEKERMAAVLAGTAQPANAREYFEAWYWDLAIDWQRRVRTWLREVDPLDLADYLDQFDVPAATVN